MAVLRFSINQRTSKELAEAAAEKIRDAVIERARDNFKKSKSTIEDVVDNVIREKNYLFQPTDQEAYELGIGANGTIDENKRSNAWEVLLVSSRRGVTRVTTRRGEGKTGIGNIQIHINYLALFEQPECHVYDEDLDIPWMQWLIEGGEVLEHQFFGSRLTGSASRTGGGIMIKGGLWRFPPQSNLINDLQISIAAAINAYINRFVTEELSK